GGWHAEANWNGLETMGAIEIEIQTGVKDIEPANPCADCQREQPWLPTTTAADGKPPANWRHSHGQTEKELRPGRGTACKGIPEHDAQRERRQRKAARIQSPGRVHKYRRCDHDKSCGLSTSHRTARQFPTCRPRIHGIDLCIDEPVEPHRCAPRRDHRYNNPDDGGTSNARMLGTEKGTSQGEREREDRMTEANERQVDREAP